MITRTSKHILKYQNNNKSILLSQLFIDYKTDLQFYIDLIWNHKLQLARNLSSKTLPSNKITHSRWKQNIYKQASEIVRSNIKKKRKSKPIIKNISITLDERLFNLKLIDSNEFNSFVKIYLPYFNDKETRALTINIPIKNHIQSNKYKEWNLKKSIKLKQQGNNIFLNFIYEKEIELKQTGNEIGMDSGYNKLFVTSDKQFIGANLKQLYTNISNKKQKSKSFNRALIHRNEEINKEIKNIDLSNIKTIYIENLTNLNKNSSKRKKKINHKQMNKQQRWIYSYALKRLERQCEEQGINVVKVSPQYTSQRCSKCGAIHSESRKGEKFECIVCGKLMDADYNAALNILHRGKYGISTEKSK